MISAFPRLTGISRVFASGFLAACVCGLAPQISVGQLPQIRLDAVFPPGAQIGTSVDVTVTNTGEGYLDEANRLIFSNPGIKASQKMQDSAGKKVAIANQYVVTVDKSVKPGMYEVRTVGLYGVSNPRTFVVSSRKEIQEKEANNSFELATPIELNSVVNARSNGVADIDFYKFQGKSGQRVIISPQAGKIDSRMRITLEVFDSNHRRLTYAPSVLLQDPVVDVKLPTDGEYYIKVYDFSYLGNNDYFYRMAVHTGPHIDYIVPPAGLPGSNGKYTVYGRNLPSGTLAGVTVNGQPLEKVVVNIALPKESTTLDATENVGSVQSGIDAISYSISGPGGVSNSVLVHFATGPVVTEKEPNNDGASAQVITVPGEFAGQFQQRGDIDYVQFSAKKGDVYWIELFGQRMGSLADGYMTVQQVQVDAKGVETGVKKLTTLDDNATNLAVVYFETLNDDPIYKFTAAADGNYRVVLRDRFFESRGNPLLTYRLAIRREQHDFRVIAVPNVIGVANVATPMGVCLRKNENFGLPLIAFRRDGYAGAIDVSVEGLPAGVTCKGATIGTGQNGTTLMFSTTENCPEWCGNIRIIAKGKIEDQTKVKALAVAKAQIKPAQDGLKKVDDALKKAVDVATKAVDSAKKAETAAKKTDDVAKQAETVAQNAQKTLENAKKADQTAKAEKVAADAAKTKAAADKKTAETAKKTAEAAKKTAEAAKKVADAAKQAAEVAKKAADDAKKAEDAAKKAQEIATATKNSEAAAKQIADATKKIADATRLLGVATKQITDTTKKAAEVTVKLTAATKQVAAATKLMTAETKKAATARSKATADGGVFKKAATAATQANQKLKQSQDAKTASQKKLADATVTVTKADQEYKASIREVSRVARAGTVIWAGAQNTPAFSRLTRDLCVCVIKEAAPVQVTTSVFRVNANRSRQILVPIKLIKKNGFDLDVNLTFVGQPKNVQVAATKISKGKTDDVMRIFLPTNAPLGTYTLYAKSTVSINHRRNVEKADRLKKEAAAAVKVATDQANALKKVQAERDNANKQATQTAAVLKTATAAKVAAAKIVTTLDVTLKKATADKAKADQAVKDAETKAKAATDKAAADQNEANKKAAAAAAKVVAQSKQNQQKLAKSLADAQTKSKQAAEKLTAAEKALTDANTKNKLAVGAKTKGDAKFKDAEAKKKAADAEKARLDKASKAAAAASKAVKKNYFPYSTPIIINITEHPATLTAAVPGGGAIKKGQKIDVKVTVKRTNGFAGPVTLTLPLPPNVKGLKAKPVQIAADKNEGVLTIEAAGDATEGALKNMVVRAEMDFNGKAAVDQPITLKVNK